MSTFGQAIPVCIPARWAALRFPGKLLQPFGAGTVLSHAVEKARAAALGPVCVLAADEQIEAEALRVGVAVHRVTGAIRNGSERIAAALRLGLLGEPQPEIVLNLQADAVGITRGALAACVQALLDDTEASLATCAVRGDIAEHHGRTTLSMRVRSARSGSAGSESDAPHCRKTGQTGRAIAFSRRALPPSPVTKGSDEIVTSADSLAQSTDSLLLHLGIYAYRVPALLAVTSCPPGPLELHESLEQLRWIEQGHAVAVRVLDGPADGAHAIDRPGDLASALN